MAGLVIHSGLASGLRVPKPDLEITPNIDFFPNIDLIKFVNCPIFIIHGSEDKLIPMNLAQRIYENTR